MRAAVFHPSQDFSVKRFTIEEQDSPIPGPGEALVAVEACGICGSDRQLVENGEAPAGTQFPAVLGHEIAGRIVSLGAAAKRANSGTEESFSGEVTGELPESSQEIPLQTASGCSQEKSWQAGDEVLVYPFISCGKCSLCQSGLQHLCAAQKVIGYHRPGGFADQVAVPVGNLLPRPGKKRISAAASALLVDAFATPFHALRKVRLSSGEHVVVIGAGGLGAAALLVAKSMGAKVGLLTRRETALIASPECFADIQWCWSDGSRKVARGIRRWGQGGVDVVIDTTGSAEIIESALDFLRPGGRLAMVGMQAQEFRFPIAKSVRRGLTVATSYGSEPEDVRDLIGLVETGNLDAQALVGAVFPLTEIQAAFERQSAFGRAVVVP